MVWTWLFELRSGTNLMRRNQWMSTIHFLRLLAIAVITSLVDTRSRLGALLVGRASSAPLTIEGHLWACRSILRVWVSSHSEEWVLRSSELLVGRASIAPLTLEGHLWACRSLQSVWVPSHSEEWVLRSPELCDRSLSSLVELALLPSP